MYFSPRTLVRLQEYFKIREDIQLNSSGMMYAINTPLFVRTDKTYHRLSKNAVENVMETLGEISGVTRLHPHLLRATFATNLARRGVDIHVIAKALGHANLRTIERYVLLTPNQISLALRGIGNVA